MKYGGVVIGTLFVFSAVVGVEGGSQTGKATLYNAQGKEVGTALLSEGSEGVNILLKVHDLPPGPHGFHIHAIGKCDPPDFASASGHFNPQGKKHGVKNPEGAHAGDLPNLLVGPDGTAKIGFIVPGVTLGLGSTSLFHSGGTALVIHANQDDEMTDPAGGAGARIACGVMTE